MLEELLRLLTEFGTDEDLIELARRFGAEEGAAALSDDELDTLLTGLTALADDDEASAAILGEAADAAVAIRGEQGRREDEAAQEEADRQAAAARLRGEDPSAAAEGDEPTDGEDGTDDGDGTGEGDDGTGDEPADGEGTDAPTADATPEPVAAAAPARRARRRTMSRRVPPENQPTEGGGTDDDDRRPGFTITLGADLPNVATGATVDTLAEVDKIVLRKARSYGKARGNNGKVHVATIEREAFADEDRRLTDDRGRALAPWDASERIQRVLRKAIAAAQKQTPQARIAAGGICGPLTPIYDVEPLGETGRPVRDSALVSFMSTRGGVVSTAPPTILDGVDAVGAWTVTMDETAAENDGDGGDVVKPYMRIECGTPRETEIEAIFRRVRFGNLMARTNSEWVEAVTTTTLVAQDRFAEARHLARMRTLSTVTDLEAPQVSAMLDTLDALSRAAWGIRSRHRLSRNFPMRVVLPELMLGVFQTDASRRMPGSTFENLRLAEQELGTFFASRSLNVTWTPDLNVQGAQAAGPLAEWPDQFQWLVYPEGTFIHLDAGELDLGIYRDSALNDVNDAELFAETFEAVHMLGVESIAGTVRVCPSGSVVGTTDPAAVCGVNS